MKKNAIDNLQTSEANKHILRKLYNQLTEEQKGQFTRILRSESQISGQSREQTVIAAAIKYASYHLKG